MIAAVAMLGLSVVTTYSQQAPTPPPATPPPTAAPNARAGFSVLMDSADLVSQRRRFEAGTRSYWHTHDKGFLILVESGVARVQKKGEPMKELRAGAVDYTPPNVLHWHGAGPNEPLIQLGMSFGGAINFTEPVTDAQYNGK